MRAVGMGAYDFFAKPFEPELLALTLDRARCASTICNRTNWPPEDPAGQRPVGSHHPRRRHAQKVCRLIERVASANVTAMLLGESGTGGNAGPRPA